MNSQEEVKCCHFQWETFERKEYVNVIDLYNSAMIQQDFVDQWLDRLVYTEKVASSNLAGVITFCSEREYAIFFSPTFVLFIVTTWTSTTMMKSTLLQFFGVII